MSWSIASVTLTDLLRPRSEGAQVNAHVLTAPKELAPDYEAMRKLVATPEDPPILGHERDPERNSRVSV